MFATKRLGNTISRVVISGRTHLAIGRKGGLPSTQQVLLGVRYFSDGTNNANSSLPATTTPVDVPVDSINAIVDEKLVDAAVAVANVEPPGLVAGKLMEGIDWIHNFMGIPYWEAIVVGTVFIRFLILPIAIKTVQATARMAAMRPEMQRLQDSMNADSQIQDIKTQARYAAEMKALFKKYQVNPLRAMMWPFAQFPVFIGCFFALKDMGTYYPGLTTGGTLWFENLAIADPYYALPVINALTFLIMIELGAQDGFNMKQAQTMKNVMRGLAVVMIPATASFSQALFVYWGTNNILSIAQTYIMKNEKVRAYFNIPKVPKPEETPLFKPKSPIQAIKEMMESQTRRNENVKSEIMGGKTVPKPPTTPPPVTFNAPPKAKKNEKK